MVLAQHHVLVFLPAAIQFAEAADMLSITYQPICCGEKYVADLRLGQENGGFPGPIQNITLLTAVAYRAFRNAISDGSARCRGGDFTPVISTLANALAFISMSTSA